MKESLKERKTHDIEFRKRALNSLIKAYESMKPQIEQALKLDLGYNQFTSNFLAHAVTLGEIKDVRDNFESWAKPQSVDTPLGTFKTNLSGWCGQFKHRVWTLGTGARDVSLELSYLYGSSSGSCCNGCR